MFRSGTDTLTLVLNYMNEARIIAHATGGFFWSEWNK